MPRWIDNIILGAIPPVSGHNLPIYGHRFVCAIFPYRYLILSLGFAWPTATIILLGNLISLSSTIISSALLKIFLLTIYLIIVVAIPTTFCFTLAIECLKFPPWSWHERRPIVIKTPTTVLSSYSIKEEFVQPKTDENERKSEIIDSSRKSSDTTWELGRKRNSLMVKNDQRRKSDIPIIEIEKAETSIKSQSTTNSPRIRNAEFSESIKRISLTPEIDEIETTQRRTQSTKSARRASAIFKKPIRRSSEVRPPGFGGDSSSSRSSSDIRCTFEIEVPKRREDLQPPSYDEATSSKSN